MDRVEQVGFAGSIVPNERVEGRVQNQIRLLIVTEIDERKSLQVHWCKDTQKWPPELRQPRNQANSPIRVDNSPFPWALADPISYL